MAPSLSALGPVLRQWGRLLVRHWPALLVVALLGVACRNAALWAAVKVSDSQSFLAQLIMIATPIGYLLAMIAALLICRRSLSVLSAVASSEGPIAVTERRERRLVDVFISVLVPFLAVYSMSGMLSEDRDRFIGEASFDEFTKSFDGNKVDFADRAGFYSFWVLAAIVAGAWLVRWLLGRLERSLRWIGFAFAGALVEVFYSGQLAASAEAVVKQIRNWLANRQGLHWAYDGYQAALDQLADVGIPLRWLSDLAGSVLGTAENVLLVPISWLTVAAVVLGHKLSTPETESAGREGRLRGWVGAILADLRERLSALLDAWRLVISTGLFPMLGFCLIFALTSWVNPAVSWATRLLVGPEPTNRMLAFSPWESGAALTLSVVLIAPLLAAMIEWLVPAMATSAPLERRTAEPRSAAEPPRSVPPH